MESIKQISRRRGRQLILYREVNPIDRNLKDMLNVMLNGRDPRTRARMSDDGIIDNLLTFLIAGLTKLLQVLTDKSSQV
ncbi:hypothetical protein C8J55DRAFT_499326 [Lentinula edodes]|uniref:Uncharacterized protein n=1 Tax=Lentinula lateritia TaxID=40482 RepID=A0A9W9AYK6_9AGAR|nr:hypothetical protein C8J55DRAFT_499326 [Lentinula edodes]